MAIQVSLHHVRMAASRRRVLGRTAQDFRKERGNVFRVVDVHIGEDRGKDRVDAHSFVEPIDQPIERRQAADPFI
jgi:hypothetical protein